jgi:hypothetical protein
MVIACLAVPAWGYINGGDYHDTFKDFQKGLKTWGWATQAGPRLLGDCHRNTEVAKGVTSTPPDNEDYQKYVNRLVGLALRELPEKDRDAIPLEAKREVARLAREAIHDAMSKNEQVISKGQTGTLRYQVGVYRYEHWWETNYTGEGRRIHARGVGMAPFIALKFDPKK